MGVNRIANCDRKSTKNRLPRGGSKAEGKGSKAAIVSARQGHSAGLSVTFCEEDHATELSDRPKQYNTEPMELTYVTDRFICVTFPTGGSETSYRHGIHEAADMLRSKHGDKYLVANLSEKRRDLSHCNSHVREVGWPPSLAPSLDRIYSLCKLVEEWLAKDPAHVIVLHCKGGLGRLATIVAACINFSQLSTGYGDGADRADMKKFFDEQLGPALEPSQTRYVRYFSNLISGSLRVSGEPVYLQHVMIHGVPQFDRSGSCQPFIKIYQNMQPVFTSNVYSVSPNQQRICISLPEPVELRGDILVQAYHRDEAGGGREPIFRLQFHTATVCGDRLIAAKCELDEAILDSRFVDSGRVELLFTDSSQAYPSNGPDLSLLQDGPSDPIVRSDSYEEFNKGSFEGLVGLTPESSVDIHTREANSGELSEQHFPAVRQDLFTDGSERIISTGTHYTHYQGGSTIEGGQMNGDVVTACLPPPSNGGFGITNVSSRGNVSLTVLPPHVKPGGVGATISTPSHSNQDVGNVSISATNKGFLATTGPSLIRSAQHTYSDNQSLPRAVNSGSAGSSPRVANLSSSSAGSPGGFVTSPRTMVHNTAHHKATHASSSVSLSPRLVQRQSPVSVTVKSTSRSESSPSGGGVSPASPHRSGGRGGSKTGQKSIEEQMDLDKILQDLLGETNPSSVSRSQYVTSERHQHNTVNSTANIPPSPNGEYSSKRSQYVNADGSHTTIERRVYPRNDDVIVSGTSPTRENRSLHQVHYERRIGQPGEREVVVGEGGEGWLEQQQKKLAQRQAGQEARTPPARDPQLMSELKFVQQRRRPSQGDDDDIDGGTYLSQKDIIVQQQPVAYTVMITPNEEPKPVPPPPCPAPQPDVSKKTVTNVNKTFHTHYNFQGEVPGHSELDPVIQQRLQDQQQRILELEAKISNLDSKMDQKPSPPKQEEEEVISLRPIGIQTLENSSSTMQRNPIEMDDSYTFNRVGTANLNSGYQQQPSQFSTLKSQQGQTGTMRSNISTLPQHAPPQSPYSGVGTLPPTPYTALSPTGGGGFSVGQYSPQQQQQQQQSQEGGYVMQQQETRTTQHTTQGPVRQPYFGGGSGQQHTMNGESGGQYQQQQHQQSASNTMHTDMIDGGGMNSMSRQGGHVHFDTASQSDANQHFAEQNYDNAKFVKDTSKYWYMPRISREDAINMLKDQPPGTFLVRDSNSFPGAFGLAVKVSQLPMNVQSRSAVGDISTELVRFFLIEPTSKGVRLKGCANEPTFGSLAALIYQHTVTALALPCKLLLPDPDHLDAYQHGEGAFMVEGKIGGGSAVDLLAKGAACNVLYLGNMPMESLTGPAAVSRAVTSVLNQSDTHTNVNFKVSTDGITLTDISRRVFFRKHFAREAVSYCGIDSADRRITQTLSNGVKVNKSRIFGFVAKSKGNTCWVFAEMEPEQPAEAIVNFITKVMMKKEMKY